MKTLLTIHIFMVTGLLQPAFSNEAARIGPSTFTATYGEKDQMHISGKLEAGVHLVAFSVTAFGKTHALTNEHLGSLGWVAMPPEVIVGSDKMGNSWYVLRFRSLLSQQLAATITVEDSVDSLKFVKAEGANPNPAAQLVLKDGFVPDENTAVNVAKAILTPAVGNANAISYAPYKATLKGDLWIVEGTTKGPGGTPVLEISKQDGKIVRLYHTQ